jgi:hypothetical protein
MGACSVQDKEMAHVSFSVIGWLGFWFLVEQDYDFSGRPHALEYSTGHDKDCNVLHERAQRRALEP